MPIQVSCPQCQKGYTLSDDKRGKQIRCKDCFQVFHAGTPPADADAANAAPEPAAPPRPAPKPKPAAVKPAAPKQPAAVKESAKKSAPAAAPQSFADLELAGPADSPTTSKYRRRRSRGRLLALLALFMLLLLGGGAAAVGVLAYLGKLPINLASLGIGVREAANTSSDKPDAGDPTPKPDHPDSAKPDLPDAPKETTPDKAGPTLTKETFDKIERGMTKPDLIALLGPPSENRGESLVWKAGGEQILVTLPQGKVISKANSQHWPIVYPGDVAVAPAPPDKPIPAALTHDQYARIDKGMTAKEVTALLGAPLQSNPGVSPADQTSTWMITGVLITVTTHDGKVVSKSSNQNWQTAYASDVVKNPPPAAALTQQNFDKIDKDMTKEQVIALLGPPTQNQGTEADSVYLWRDRTSTVIVALPNGKVNVKTNLQNWPVVYPSEVVKNPPPDNAVETVTQANFDKVDKGMSEKELSALLGAKHGMVPLPLLGGQNLTWRSKDFSVTIFVTMKDDKLVSKISSVNWPIVYASDAGKVPPDKPKGVTRETYDKIDKGMTLDDLKALLGAVPNSTDKGAFGEFDTQWNWPATDGGVISVQALQGKTVSKTNTLKWPVAYPTAVVKDPPPPDKPDAAKFAAAVNKENFDKIAKGMSKDALTDLFGPPAEVKPRPQPGVDERLIWQAPAGKIMVGMTSGKVVSKLATQDWPIVYPK